MVGPMKRYFIALLAAAIAVACAPEELVKMEQVPDAADNLEKIFVSIENQSTRVQLNSKLQTVWTRGDEVVTFHPGNLIYWCRFDGNTGDRYGELTRYARGSFGADPGFTTNYAVYPPSSLAGAGTAGSNPALFLNFPDTQVYQKDSYSVGSNILVAESSDPYNYNFMSVSSFLRLHLVGGKAVTEITVKGNNNETLAGIFYFVVTDMVKCNWYQEVSNEITLDCGPSVQLSDTPTAFYISMLPTTFQKGITVTIKFSDGTQIAKSTSKKIVMERNAILPMATIATDSSNWQTVEFVHSTNTFQLPVFGGSSSISGFIYWGDGNQTSLTTSTGSYIYWGNQPSYTVVTKTEGATTVEFPSLKGVSEINFSNF